MRASLLARLTPVAVPAAPSHKFIKEGWVGTYSNGRGERACPFKTQRSVRFLIVNETPRSGGEEERTA
jgi:hypothetical protein